MIDDQLIAFFYKHIVPIFFSFRRGEDSQHFVVTAFVLSVQDHWFLITAGHCLEKVDEIINVHGYELVDCVLIDSLGEESKHVHPIPFLYNEANPACLSESYDLDYGVIEISPYYKNLLITNNIQPLTEEVWKKQPSKVDFYALLGLPAELTKSKPNQLELSPTLFTVEQMAERPEGFAETEFPRFYGRIALGDDIKSIEGVSGGPVFAFYKNDIGELRYWLVALQSRWLQTPKFIAACYTRILGDFLEDVIESTK